jgi:hypothetical protein
VTMTSRRTPLARSTGRATSRRSRPLLAVLLSLGLALSTASCGMNVQTNNPYTPAEGVNFDVGSVHIRNVMILSRTAGEGFLSASMVSAESDTLTQVTGTAIKSDGSPGSALTITLPQPVTVGGNKLVVLTDRQPLITVKSADLQSGLVARLVLTFSTAGEVTTTAPVVDANQQAYRTITPSPSAPASPTPSS